MITFWPRFVYLAGDFSPFLALIVISFTLAIFAIYKLFKSSEKVGKKKIILSVIFSYLTFVIFFSTFEFYFRYVYDESDGLGFLKTNIKWQERHVVHNNFAFRDEDFEIKKQQGEFRIGILGDSLTFGGGIKNVDDRFSNLLENKLKQINNQVQVHNLGVPGTDTTDQILNYRRVMHLDYDLVIWQYFPNDIQPKNESTGQEIIVNNRKKSSFAQFFTDKSYFIDFIYWRFSTKYQRTLSQIKVADINQYKNERVLEAHKEEIGEFIDELKKEDKEVVFVIFPFINLLGPDYPQYIHENIASFVREKDVKVIDLLDDFQGHEPSELMANKFDAHPNEFAQTIAAEKLEQEFKKLEF